MVAKQQQLWGLRRASLSPLGQVPLDLAGPSKKLRKLRFLRKKASLSSNTQRELRSLSAQQSFLRIAVPERVLLRNLGQRRLLATRRNTRSVAACLELSRPTSQPEGSNSKLSVLLPLGSRLRQQHMNQIPKVPSGMLRSYEDLVSFQGAQRGCAATEGCAATRELRSVAGAERERSSLYCVPRLLAQPFIREQTEREPKVAKQQREHSSLSALARSFALALSHSKQLREQSSLTLSLVAAQPSYKKVAQAISRASLSHFEETPPPPHTATANFYCIFFCVFIHIVCLNLLGLSFLESIYGTLCFLLICSFILSKNKILLNSATFLRTCFARKLQPSRSTNLLVFPQNKTLSMKIGHMGIVFFITGIILSNTYKVQFTQLMRYGDLIRLGPHSCCLRSIDHAYAPSFHSICGNLFIYSIQNQKVAQQSKIQSEALFSPLFEPLLPLWQPNGPEGCLSDYWRLVRGAQHDGRSTSLFCMFPEKRFFFSNQELTTTKVAIHTNLFTDFYGLIGTGSMETGWYTTIMKLPFIFCIWLGFLLATIGGAIGLKRLLQKSKLNWV